MWSPLSEAFRADGGVLPVKTPQRKTCRCEWLPRTFISEFASQRKYGHL